MASGACIGGRVGGGGIVSAAGRERRRGRVPGRSRGRAARDLLGRAQAAKTLDRGLDEVDRVLRAEALGEDVVDAGELEHRAHAAAGDHAGAGRGGLQQDATGAEYAGRLMGDRAAVAGHPEQVLLGPLDALLDRERNLVGLAVADADRFALVADDDQRGEREATAALDDLGDAVDLDDPLLEVEAGRADERSDVIGVIGGRRERVAGWRPASDRQARLADRFGERADVAVVAIAATIEHCLGHTGGLRPLGQQLAGARGGLGFAQRAQLGLEPGDCRERARRRRRR